MNVLKVPASTALLFLLITVLAATSAAQQKRQAPAKPQPRAARPTPPPTFDTLLAADSYKIYGEVRGVGQLIRSNSVNDILEPIMMLAGPPKEFKTLVKWLNMHADQVMTSRMLVAAWPTAQEVPTTIVAIEFASAEEAARFRPQLNEFLPKVLPDSPPESSSQSADEPTKTTSTDNRKQTAKPGYYLQQAGNLILITPTPLTLKKLRPVGSKLLAEDLNFRVARNRFNSESIFVFIDFKGIEREEEEQRKRYQEENKKLAEAQANAVETGSEDTSKEVQNPLEVELPDEERASVETETRIVMEVLPTADSPKEAPTPDPVSTALSMLASSFFSGQSHWPDAIGIAISLSNDSFDLRALMVNALGEKSDPVPFAPMLIAGSAFVPESPNILPADTELFVTMSLDLPQIYSAMSKPSIGPALGRSGTLRTVGEVEFDSPFAAIEKQLKIKVKDDLLPLLGSEIALSLPVKNLDIVGPPGPPGPPLPNPETNNDTPNQQSTPGPVVAISLKDREGMRALLPKLVDSLGFKGASSLAQTERREDTEIVSFANFFSYAFIGNFLVLTDNVATTRHIVDSYLKHETLSGDGNFKNYTRWQPRQLQGQVYVSSALMESYKSWAEQPSVLISDQTRSFLTRLSVIAQPVTYALSNEGLGPLHELHVPKNLVLMAVAGISGEVNPPATLQNERITLAALSIIASAEERYKTEKGSGSYATLEQLVAAEMFSAEMMENHGYRLSVTITGSGFEVSALPLEYGKTGSVSYFIDQTGVLRGGDHGGGLATSADQPIR